MKITRHDDWLPDPAILLTRPGWMPEDAEALGEGRFRWSVGRTEVHADLGGVTRFVRGGEDVECVCDPATGIACQQHA